MALPYDNVLRALGLRTPHHEQREALLRSGLTQQQTLDIVANLARYRHTAEADLAAAVTLAQAGIAGDEITTIVRLCRSILDREQVTPGWAATRDQMTATAEMFAAVHALAGGIVPVQSIVRYVMRWKESV